MRECNVWMSQPACWGVHVAVALELNPIKLRHFRPQYTATNGISIKKIAICAEKNTAHKLGGIEDSRCGAGRPDQENLKRSLNREHYHFAALHKNTGLLENIDSDKDFE